MFNFRRVVPGREKANIPVADTRWCAIVIYLEGRSHQPWKAAERLRCTEAGGLIIGTE